MQLKYEWNKHYSDHTSQNRASPDDRNGPRLNPLLSSLTEKLPPGVRVPHRLGAVCRYFGSNHYTYLNLYLHPPTWLPDP
jgi:hypothetical protein